MLVYGIIVIHIYLSVELLPLQITRAGANEDAKRTGKINKGVIFKNCASLNL